MPSAVHDTYSRLSIRIYRINECNMLFHLLYSFSKDPQHTCAKSLQLCPTFCDLTDCSLPSFSFVHGILQVRILERVAMPSSRQLPDPGIEPVSPPLAGFFFFLSQAPPGVPKDPQQQQLNIACNIYFTYDLIHFYHYLIY